MTEINAKSSQNSIAICRSVTTAFASIIMSSQNAYEKYKFVNVCNLMKKTGKKQRVMAKS